MDNLKRAAIIAGTVIGLASPAYAAEISQNSVLSGTVTSVIDVNTAVKEGQVLATVDSLVGDVPAARASADGVVVKVLVTKGQNITKQDVVAVIETK